MLDLPYVHVHVSARLLPSNGTGGGSAPWHWSLAQEHTIAVEAGGNRRGARDGAVVKEKKNQTKREKSLGDQIMGKQQQILGCSVKDLGD